MFLKECTKNSPSSFGTAEFKFHLGEFGHGLHVFVLWKTLVWTLEEIMCFFVTRTLEQIPKMSNPYSLLALEFFTHPCKHFVCTLSCCCYVVGARCSRCRIYFFFEKFTYPQIHCKQKRTSCIRIDLEKRQSWRGPAFTLFGIIMLACTIYCFLQWCIIAEF